MNPRRALAVLVTLAPLAAGLLFGSGALAAGAPLPAPPQESWAGQLETLSSWLEAHKTKEACTEHCFTLERLSLKGSLADASVSFELTGGVLTDQKVAVPLFGPPSQVRLEAVTEDGQPAAVGFDDTGYFVFTSAKRFTVRGKLALGSDLALQIPGPLNVLDADLAGGHVVEGAHLAGLKGATIHFDRSTGDEKATEPTVFQLSRAVRVGRAIDFEYRLVMRSGTDLGVARVPLTYGEKVLDVTGSTGWRVDGGELVLPTAGHNAEIVVHGTLPSDGSGKPDKPWSFAPDARSPYEWWLVESDPEHRVTVKGDAGQVDASQSPVPRTQTSSRLYLVQRGQHLDVSVQTLSSAEILAAVVRSEHRDIVLTRSGDLVADDTLTYENNGIDYLSYDPRGRPIYLALDGKADRIMHDDASHDVLVPLSAGSHQVRVQSLAQAGIATFGGRLNVPEAHHSLTQSTSSIMLGLPRRVHPILALGGDRAEWFIGLRDVMAMAVAIGLAWATMKKRTLRVAAAIALGGTWFVSSTVFVALVGLVLAGYGIALTYRLARGKTRGVVVAMAAAACGVLWLATVGMTASSPREERAWNDKVQSAENNIDTLTQQAAQSNTRYGARGPVDERERAGKDGTKLDGDALRDDKNAPQQAILHAGAGVLEGVTPVALTLPSYDHAVTLSRELVTKDRPFSPIVYYVTDWALLPLLAAWLLAAAFLVRAHRAEIASLREKIKERLTPKAEAMAPAASDAPAE